MITTLHEPRIGIIDVTDDGCAFLQIRDGNGGSVMISSKEPYDFITLLTRAADQLNNKLLAFDADEPVSRWRPPLRTVDIADIDVGDQIRIQGFWHGVAQINDHPDGITIKTTRNEWFAYDHGDRVTVGSGVDNE